MGMRSTQSSSIVASVVFETQIEVQCYLLAGLTSLMAFKLTASYTTSIRGRFEVTLPYSKRSVTVRIPRWRCHYQDSLRCPATSTNRRTIHYQEHRGAKRSLESHSNISKRVLCILVGESVRSSSPMKVHNMTTYRAAKSIFWW